MMTMLVRNGAHVSTVQDGSWLLICKLVTVVRVDVILCTHKSPTPTIAHTLRATAPYQHMESEEEKTSDDKPIAV